MKKILSYDMPDMDGVSCMIGYAEFLNQKGENCKYIIKGEPKREVNIVCDKFKINLKKLLSYKLNANDEVILVDTNELGEINQKINYNNVVEIIDHHHISDKLNKMKNAKVQIEKIGAAATLVTEKYMNSKANISKDSAIMLYYGIISNTMNFNANATERDMKAANWREIQSGLKLKSYIREIFIEKSKIPDLTSLRNEMDMEYKNETLKISWSMGQLEVANVKEFIDKNKDNIINTMEHIRQERKIELLSVNCIDILNGYTIIISLNNKTTEILFNALKFDFKNGLSYIPKIITRKEISEKVWEKYGK